MIPYYEDAAVQIYCGDVFEVLEHIDVTVDAVITDPPYSSGGAYRGDRTDRAAGAKYTRTVAEVQNGFTDDNRDQRGFLMWSGLWLSLCRQRLRPSGNVLVFSDWRQLPTLTDAAQVGGLVYRGVGVWHKRGGKPNNEAFRAGAEFIVHASHGKIDQSDHYPDPVFSTAIEQRREHLTQKPLAVMEWLVGFCPVGGIVLDPFIGSGSTLVAAVTTGRHCIGIDHDEHWCEVAARRVRDATPAMLDAR